MCNESVLGGFFNREGMEGKGRRVRLYVNIAGFRETPSQAGTRLKRGEDRACCQIQQCTFIEKLFEHGMARLDCCSAVNF